MSRATGSVLFGVSPPRGFVTVRNPSLSNNPQVVALEASDGANQTVEVATVTTTSSDAAFVPRTNGVLSGMAYYPKLNLAGTAVSFDSSAPNFVAGDTNNASDVFEWDLPDNAVHRVSVTSGGGQTNGDSSYGAWVPGNTNGDIMFASWATNIVSGDTNGHQDIFQADAHLGYYLTLNRLVGGNGDSSLPSPASNGFFAFISKASDLVPSDTNGVLDVFVKDAAAPPETTQVWRTSLSYLEGQATGASSYPQISTDGRWVSYETDATDIAASDTNGVTDVITGFAQTVSVRFLSPSVFTRGVTNYPVTITGQGFSSPVTLSASNSDATFSNVVVVNSKKITANVTVSASAAATVTLQAVVTGGPITGQGSSGDCACISTVP